MTRLRHLAFALSSLCALSFAACADEPAYTGRVVVDLNRTASEPVSVRSVLADSVRAFSLLPDVNGVYSFVSDTLPPDIYVLTFDSAHVLPLVVAHGAAQQVCGTLREWESLAASCPETRAVIAAEAMRRRLAGCADSALTAANVASQEGRRVVADSLGRVRAAFRVEANAWLAQLADTSLAALPFLGLPGLFDDAADNAMLLRRVSALVGKWPAADRLALRRDHLLKVSRLNSLREAYAAGASVPDFLFVSSAADSITSASLSGKRMALAVLPDSASTPRSVVARLGLLALDGAQVLVESSDGNADVAGRNVAHGRFARMGGRAEVDAFKPVVIIVGKDGRVERLSIGK